MTLTATQARILRLHASGLDDFAIAAELWCSYQTVRWHFKRIAKALGTHTRSEAVAVARREGLL